MNGTAGRALSVSAMALACIVGFWFTPHTLGITDLDEGLYVAAAREMALTGDWVTPRVNGTPFYEKPPLLYWLSSAALRAFGRSEWAVRLPSAIAATLTLLAVFAFGRRYLGGRAALFAALALALAPLTVASARLATTDAMLVLAVTCSLFAAHRAREVSGAASLRWSLVSFGLAGLASLAKGAAGCLTVPAVLLAYDLIVRRVGIRRLLRSAASLRALWGLALFAGIMAPWHVAAWKANGSAFVQEYLVRQHIGRFQGGDTAHHAPVWFYVPGFLIGFFPWSLFSIAELRPERRAVSLKPGQEPEVKPGEADAAALQARTLGFLRCWFTVVVLLFSLGGSKLISYILPMYPAAALLAGSRLARACSGPRSGRSIVIGSSLGLIALAAVYAALVQPAPIVAVINRYADRPVTVGRLDADILTPAAYLLGTIGLGLAASLGAAVLGRARLTPAILALTMALFYLGVLTQGVPLAQRRMIGTLHRMASLAGKLAGPHDMVAIAIEGPRRPSALFYLPDGVISSGRVIEANPVTLGTGLLSGTSPANRGARFDRVYAVVDTGRLAEAVPAGDSLTPVGGAVVRAGRYSLIRVEPEEGAPKRIGTP